MVKYRDAAKSELDAQRELLDSLMGINRNNDRKGDQVMSYKDDRVCKFFLTGMCPHDIFVNTKMDEGPCPKVHSEALKVEFESGTDRYMYDNIIEKEFISRLNEADRVIKRARLRVEDDKLDEELNPDINPDIMRIHGEISKVIKTAEESAEAGDIDKAQELILVKMDDLLKEKQGVLTRINELKKQRSGPDKKLRVCDVCGSFLSILDSDKRLQDHFLGKQHMGFQYMRDGLEAIRKRREEKRNNGTKDRLERGEIAETTRPVPAAGARRDYDDNRGGRGGGGGGGARRDGSRDRGRRDEYRRDDYRRRDDSRNRNDRGGGGRNERSSYRRSRSR